MKLAFKKSTEYIGKDRIQCSINDTIQWYSLMTLFWFVLDINSFTCGCFGSISGNVNTVKKENNFLYYGSIFDVVDLLKGVSGILRVGQSTPWNLCFKGCALKKQSVLVYDSYYWLPLVRCFIKGMNPERTGRLSSWTENDGVQRLAVKNGWKVDCFQIPNGATKGQ